MTQKPRRAGLSLVETLLVISIIGTAIALLLPAVLMVRDAALRVYSQNNMRQLGLATHNFADEHGGRLPTVDGALRSPNPGKSLLVALLPYIEQDNLAASISKLAHPPLVKTYVSPADPSLTGLEYCPASYAANAQVFNGSPGLPWTFSDGTSNTIIFAEHYANAANGVHFYYDVFQADRFGHRASFADGGPGVNHFANCGDDYPRTSGRPPTSEAAWRGTFQVAPRLSECDGQLANTPHRGGMLISLGDGSSRVISAGVAPEVYWGLVTPAAGETPAADQ